MAQGVRGFAGASIALMCLVFPSLASPVLAAAEEPKSKTFHLGRGVKMEFVLIPPGSFMMGEESDNDLTRPVHKVTLRKRFYMGRYEVTQAQWWAVTGRKPSNFKGAKNPVETVAWPDCLAFAKRLTRKLSGGRFRLPTEAEWEYACRAGTQTRFYHGDDRASLGEYAWYSSNANKTHHPVGEKKPNAWGLYDMEGNVWEWCLDVLSTYPRRELKDPMVNTKGEGRVIRGGSWLNEPRHVRSAHRAGCPPLSRLPCYGFRLVFVPSAR